MFKVNKLKDTHCTSALRGSMHMNGGNLDIADHDNKILEIYIQGDTGGKDQTSGECSLC